jgi:hypothetical protein
LRPRTWRCGRRRPRLETEREILRAAAKVFRRGDELVTRFQFVADHSATTSSPGTRPGWSVKRLCALVEIERSSFYAWKAAAPARAARAATDAALAQRIRTTHAQDATCGAPRITAELNDGAPPEQRVNHKRVAQVMREHGIRGYRRRRKVRTGMWSI